MLQTQKALLKLFEDEPYQWGLRGDPHLWREMKAIVDNCNYPTSEGQLTELLRQLFQQLTGTSLARDLKPFFVEKYSHRGMSSGYISPQFWAEQAIPMLLARYRESK